jgi:hypothetical protein
LLRPVAIAVVLATALTASPRARGADAIAADEADAAIRRGVELRRHGEDQKALDEFRKAYTAGKTPRALAQMGLAEQALGRWADAETHLQQALAAPNDPWVRKNVAVLKGSFDAIQRHLGNLDVIGPEGAEVRVDGQLAGTLPLAKPVRVPIGSLTVELRKPGFFRSTRPVMIAAGELTRESMDLQAIPSGPAAPPPPSPPEIIHGSPPPKGGPAAGPLTPPPPIGPPPIPPADNANGGGWRRPAAWAAGAGALLGVAAGVTALVIRGGKISDANNLECNVMNGTVNPVNPANQGRCLDLANSASNAGIAAIVSFSVGGVLAIASGVLFARLPPKSTTTARLACGPFAEMGAICRLTF